MSVVSVRAIIFAVVGRVNTPTNGMMVHKAVAPPVIAPSVSIEIAAYVTVLSSFTLTIGFPLKGAHSDICEKRTTYPPVRQILVIIMILVDIGKLEYINDSMIRSLE